MTTARDAWKTTLPDDGCEECSCADGVVAHRACTGRGWVTDRQGEVEKCAECDGLGTVLHEDCGGKGYHTPDEIEAERDYDVS